MHTSPSPTPSAPTPRRRLPKILLLVLALGATAAVTQIAYHWALSREVNKRLDAVRAAGEPVTLEDLNKYYPQVPAASNAALIYGRAFDLVQKSPSAKFLENLDELPSGSGPLDPALRDQMRRACQENEATLALLRDAAKLSACRFPVDYTPGYAALLPHLVHLRKCSALERCRGVLNEQDGHIDEAIDSLDVITRFSASLDAEPDLISVLVQHRLALERAELLQWLMNHRRLSRDQLAKLQAIFEGDDLVDRLHKAVLGERCSTLAMFDYSPAQIIAIIDPGCQDELRVAIGLRLMRFSGNLKKDKMWFLDQVQECDKTIRLPLPDRLDRAAELRTTTKQEAAPRKCVLTGTLLPSFLKGIERTAAAEARQRLAQTALAIEQFRLARNRLPPSLADLSPEFLREPPIDPFSSQELRYRHDADGYVLYSIGPDREDDGGTKPIARHSKADRPPGDIIFIVSRK